MKIWLLDKARNFDSYENRRFQEEAERLGLELLLVAPEEFDIIVPGTGRRSLLRHGRPGELADCLLSRFGSGATYFALATIRHLEKLGLFVLNSSQSIEVGRDKLATLQILAAHNIPIPQTMLAKFPLNIEVVDEQFTYPVMIKTVSGSRGKGIFLCENKTQLEDLVDLIAVSRNPEVNVIIQEFVTSSRGKDIRVIVVGGRAIGAMLRVAQEGKFKANFSAGGSVAAWPLNPAVEWLAVESARVVGLDIAGVDLLFDGDSYRVCEVNCAPGFEGFEEATGLSVAREIYQYIQVRLAGSLP